MSDSVFARIRFEHDERPLYFLPGVIDELEEAKPRYIVGNRGTGKTTLLRALSWKERLDNESLRSQLGEDPFADSYIGLYVKVPAHHFAILETWLESVEPMTGAAIFAAYLDAIWLQHGAQAVAELIARGHFTVSPLAEHDALNAGVAEFAHLPLFRELPGRLTLLGLKRTLGKLQWQIEKWARRMIDPLDAADELPSTVGELGRVLGKALLATCQEYRSDLEQPAGAARMWRFHVCLDEAETLSRRQQIALNTLVRLTETPVLFLASFVSQPHDVISTLLPQMTLQEADLSLTVRDSIKTAEFRELVEGVATARVRALLGSSVEEFSLDRVLGQTDINALLLERVVKSENPGAERLLASARELESRVGEARGREFSSAPPIWEAYALIRKFGALPEVPARGKRFPDGALRKLSVSAYFAIHRDFNWTPRYVGAPVAVHLADSCVRDFLWQMDAILHESTPRADVTSALRSLVEASPVESDVQARAFLRASENKVARLADLVTTAPGPSTRVVTTLARTTAALQSPRASGPLDAEGGRFVLDVAHSDGEPDASLLIRDAVEAGYLKLLEQAGDTWTFRIHNSLAPYFELSWRGGYRSVRVEAAEVLTLASATEEDADKISEDFISRFKKPDGSPVQASLPLGLDLERRD